MLFFVYQRGYVLGRGFCPGVYIRGYVRGFMSVFLSVYPLALHTYGCLSLPYGIDLLIIRYTYINLNKYNSY